MPLRYQKQIYRSDLHFNPNTLYLFGDNDQRAGLGGQAGQMRGEPNAVGVRTKDAPGRSPGDYWSDNTFGLNCEWIDEDLTRIRDALCARITVICPADGLGTGLSELPERAPRTYAYMCLSLKLLEVGIFQTPREFMAPLNTPLG